MSSTLECSKCLGAYPKEANECPHCAKPSPDSPHKVSEGALFEFTQSERETIAVMIVIAELVELQTEEQRSARLAMQPDILSVIEKIGDAGLEKAKQRSVEVASLQAKLSRAEAEIERLRIIVNGYKTHGTDGCKSCESGRITLFHWNDECIICNPESYSLSQTKQAEEK